MTTKQTWENLSTPPNRGCWNCSIGSQDDKEQCKTCSCLWLGEELDGKLIPFESNWKWDGTRD